MIAASPTSAEFSLLLSEEERAQLFRVLEQALRDKEIEVHRTDALDYRQYVQREEAVLQRLLDKLRRP